MSQPLSTFQKNEVLQTLAQLIAQQSEEILHANAIDLEKWASIDAALYDRLKIDASKIALMIKAIEAVMAADDPVGRIRYSYEHPNGMTVQDKTVPFGTILIIYESRPDVTIEAAIIAFKSGNRILLKGGKEALLTNRVLVRCWHDALQRHRLSIDQVQFVEWDRELTQTFLKNPTQKIDLVVPRGGETLIAFAKQYANCPVLVSGRGNNFLYVHDDADWLQSTKIILNAKTDKISACNALDKVLIHAYWLEHPSLITDLIRSLKAHNVEIFIDKTLNELGIDCPIIENEKEWSTEYLSLKIAMGITSSMNGAIAHINTYSGGHSVSIISQSDTAAEQFMTAIDAAAVYHNASTRFTDGGELGVGAELAISTDKLHHRGPLGVHHLVTNKWYIYGNGQIR